jgi:hypothetical protein
MPDLRTRYLSTGADAQPGPVQSNPALPQRAKSYFDYGFRPAPTAVSAPPNNLLDACAHCPARASGGSIENKRVLWDVTHHDICCPCHRVPRPTAVLLAGNRRCKYLIPSPLTVNTTHQLQPHHQLLFVPLRSLGPVAPTLPARRYRSSFPLAPARVVSSEPHLGELSTSMFGPRP